MSVLSFSVVPRPALPDDLPEALRNLADAVERGEVTGMVVAYIEGGDYSFLWPSSLHDSLVLASLANATAIDRLRR